MAPERRADQTPVPGDEDPGSGRQRSRSRVHNRQLSRLGHYPGAHWSPAGLRDSADPTPSSLPARTAAASGDPTDRSSSVALYRSRRRVVPNATRSRTPSAYSPTTDAVDVDNAGGAAMITRAY